MSKIFCVLSCHTTNMLPQTNSDLRESSIRIMIVPCTINLLSIQILTVESLDTATTLALRVDDENDDSARILAHALVSNVLFVLYETYLI